MQGAGQAAALWIGDEVEGARGGGGVERAPPDRLAVDRTHPGRRVVARGDTNPLAQGTADPLPGAVAPPLLEIVPDSALGEQVVGKQFPQAAGAGLMQQGVEDFS